MHFLTAISNNVSEWTALDVFNPDRPRLPIPYALGGAFLMAGHRLSALDRTNSVAAVGLGPFGRVYRGREITCALRDVDAALLWGGDGFKALARQAFGFAAKKKILYLSYAFCPLRPTVKQRLHDVILAALSGAALGAVFMTVEQAFRARERLDSGTPVIQFRCGIDTAFYRVRPSFEHVPEFERARVSKLLAKPYVIMPGDELRFNQDALQFVERTGIRLVRVSQYNAKSGTDELKREIATRGLEDLLMVFEKIDYKFLRFLFHHACAYAGLVDSSWQPAGWTVACEALASGLPVVLYEGLTSRELDRVSVKSSFIQAVAMRDIVTVSDKLAALAASPQSPMFSEQAVRFAEQHLDFSITAPPFVSEVERVLSRI
jgi:hypothetical protein